MSAPLLVWGAGGHALTLADALQRNRLSVDAFAISDGYDGRPTLSPLIRGEAELNVWLSGVGAARYLIAIGLRGAVRQRIADQAAALGLTAARFVDQAAVVSPTAQIGPGTQVLPFAFIGPLARVGNHCIVNTGAKVEHEAVVGDYTDLAPNATVLGQAAIGARVLVGAGAVVLPEVVVCSDTIIGAGAVVAKSIDTPGTYVGIPARLLQGSSRPSSSKAISGGGID